MRVIALYNRQLYQRWKYGDYCHDDDISNAQIYYHDFQKDKCGIVLKVIIRTFQIRVLWGQKVGHKVRIIGR